MASAIPAQELQELAQNLVDAESPNPPGDVRLPLEVAAKYFDDHEIPYARVSIDRENKKVNLVARVIGAHEGPHLVLNAHLDVFPDSAGQEKSARLTDTESSIATVAETYAANSAVSTAETASAMTAASQKSDYVVGRGAVDMKSGAAAFMVVMRLLNEQAHLIHGQISLCLVCDEETFGPYGSRALLKLFPDLKGDALLSTEPSSLGVVRRGERGFMWGTVTIQGAGGHGAYPSGGQSPIEKAAAFIKALRAEIPENWQIEDNADENKQSLSHDLLAPKGQSFVDFRSLNFGVISGGLKVNMQPDNCQIELDIRLPLGQTVKEARAIVDRVAARFDAQFEVDNCGEPNASDPQSEIFRIIQSKVEQVTGIRPELAIGLGCTDARLWRYLDVPAAVYGPDPSTMARGDEMISVEDLLKIATVHLETARSYLKVNN